MTRLPWQSGACGPGDAATPTRDLELGLHIAALVGILLTSTFGIIHNRLVILD